MDTSTSILTPSEQKRLRRSYICAKAAKGAFGAMLVSGLLAVLLTMINDIFLDSSSPFHLGFLGGLTLMVLSAVVFIYMAVASKVGTSGKKYEAIVEKVSAAQKDTDSPYLAAGLGGHLAGRGLTHSKNETVQKAGKAIDAAASLLLFFAVFQQLEAMAENVAVVMDCAGMALPNTKKYSRTLFAVPVLIMLLLFIPKCVASIQTKLHNKEMVRANWHYLYDYFQAQGFEILGDNPDIYSNYPSYSIMLSLYPEQSHDLTSANLSIGRDGRISSVSYRITFNVYQDKAESVRKIREVVTTMSQEFRHAAQLGGVPPTDPRLLEVQQPLLEQFLREFEAGSPFERISLSTESALLPLCTIIYLDTRPEEECAEYPTVSVTYYTNYQED